MSSEVPHVSERSGCDCQVWHNVSEKPVLSWNGIWRSLNQAQSSLESYYLTMFIHLLSDELNSPLGCIGCTDLRLSSVTHTLRCRGLFEMPYHTWDMQMWPQGMTQGQRWHAFLEGLQEDRHNTIEYISAGCPVCVTKPGSTSVLFNSTAV